MYIRYIHEEVCKIPANRYKATLCHIFTAIPRQENYNTPHPRQ